MRNLSVLHISTADNVGGSARSAYKIHLGLKKLGVTSRMLVRYKVTGDEDVKIIADGGIKLLDQFGRFGFDKIGLQFLFYPSSFAIMRHPWFEHADIVQLYNTHGHYFTHAALPLLSRKKKVLWRLSDMWPLTGHCSYSYDCERWKIGCGQCPRLNEYPPLSVDTSNLLWRIKNQIYARSHIEIIATNSWMAGLVKESPLLSRFRTVIIPNGVDTNSYRPLSKEHARQLLGVENRSRVVLFAGNEAVPGTRKGGEFAVATLEKAKAGGLQDLVLIVLGERAESWKNGHGFETVRLGFTQSEHLLAIVYSAADVLLCPSVAENFPNTVLESFACATPAVAFNVGGIPDLVRHMETGYLARYKDAGDLASGLRLILKDESLRQTMGRRCRKMIESEFSVELQAKRFKDLYETILGK